MERNGRRGNLAARFLLIGRVPALRLAAFLALPPCLDFIMNVPCPHCGKPCPASPDASLPEVTPTEEMVLGLVREMRADGVDPSLEEMGFYMGYSPRNRGGIFSHIDHLLGKGLLVKGRSFASLQLTALGECFLSGRVLRSPGTRALSRAAREFAEMDRVREAKEAQETQDAMETLT